MFHTHINTQLCLLVWIGSHLRLGSDSTSDKRSSSGVMKIDPMGVQLIARKGVKCGDQI